MSYTSDGVTTFVLGTETDGNRSNKDYKTAKSYDLDYTDVVTYSVDAAEFPVL